MTPPETHNGDSMGHEEIVEFLQEHGHGVLALADESREYAFPVSFGYTEEDGDDVIYLYLNKFGSDSKKLDILNRTDSASLVVYNVESKNKWQSVIITGELTDLGTASGVRSLTDRANERYIRNVMEDNAWFPEFSEKGEQIKESRLFLFVIDEVSGRQGEAYL